MGPERVSDVLGAKESQDTYLRSLQAKMLMGADTLLRVANPDNAGPLKNALDDAAEKYQAAADGQDAFQEMDYRRGFGAFMSGTKWMFGSFYEKLQKAEDHIDRQTTLLASMGFLKPVEPQAAGNDGAVTLSCPSITTPQNEDAQDNIIDVAAGQCHTVALLKDGKVRVFGRNDTGQCDVPADAQGNCISAAAGGHHIVVLLKNGKVRAFGCNTCGQCDVPADV